MHTTHQEVIIPNIMEKISRERECKAEYEAFKECLAIHFDPERGANKDINVFKRLYKITRGKACHDFKDRLHICSKKAWDDPELYYEAK